MDPKAVNQCDLCLHLSNPSCSRTASSAPVCVVLYMLVAAVVLVTVCGNLLVIISICCFKHLHTPTNLILLSLAVADLLTGLTVMPFHFTIRLETCWRLGTFVCQMFYICSCVLSCVSIYSVVFIAADRYVALCDPFLYSRKMTASVSLLVVSLIWLYSLIYTIVLLDVNGNFHTGDTPLCFQECVVKISELWAYIDVMCVFVLTCSVIIIVYSKIFTVAKRHIHAITPNSKDNSKTNPTVLPEAKAALKLGIVVFVFLLCAIPYAVTLFMAIKDTSLSSSAAVTNTITPLLLNSALNPIIYALFYPWFQKCVKKMSSCFCRLRSALWNVVSYKN